VFHPPPTLAVVCAPSVAPTPDDHLVVRSASPLVNSIKNEGPELLEDLSLFDHYLSSVKYCDIAKAETHTLARRKSARAVTILSNYQIVASREGRYGN